MNDTQLLMQMHDSTAEEITKINSDAFRNKNEFCLLFNVGTGENFIKEDISILHDVRQKVYSIISGPPVCLTVDFSLPVLDDNILGQAGVTQTTYYSATGKSYPSRGLINLNVSSWTSQKKVLKNNNKSLGYYTLLHELFHVLGIGTMWSGFISNNSYFGENALREYRNAIDNQSVTFVPIEDDGGAGTAGGHLEEGNGTANGTRLHNGVKYPGLDRELMTGYSETIDDEPIILSKITIGFLDDLGYTVNYDGSDDSMYPNWAKYNDLNGGLLSPQQTVKYSPPGYEIVNSSDMFYQGFNIHQPEQIFSISSSGTLMISHFIISFSDNQDDVKHQVDCLIASDTECDFDLSYLYNINSILVMLKGISYQHDYIIFQ